ncbi:hypothetical protein [Actinoplanes sp. NPDC049802]|uniref:hypothetical protein n=1 Tax=Actinoplanes sp. NPDC049802 TaxID=3154742 RepID=UPI0034068CA4
MAWFVGQSLAVITLAFIAGVAVGRFSARFGNASPGILPDAGNAAESDDGVRDRVEDIRPTAPAVHPVTDGETTAAPAARRDTKAAPR